nr:Retrovirus-related Pol polyprotein from transposon TNT 1-94 [Ipomoea batatas]GME11532.1 Retrovirus-related Pol polyprotein from transposon TNT 1-94 [Ipomoea batatas]
MTGNANSFHNVRNMTRCPVGLPDGRSTVATKKGLVNLYERLKMHNVLYVPELNCNLISMSRLIDDSNYIVQFTKDLCVIHDRTSRMLIEAGKRRNELYYFWKIPIIRVSKVDSGGSLELWHKRLGHPSLKVTKTPTPVLNGKTSYEALYGESPRYDHLRVLDSLCYAHNQKSKGDKFVSRSRKCIFVGYSYGKERWKAYDMETGIFCIT